MLLFWGHNPDSLTSILKLKMPVLDALTFVVNKLKKLLARQNL